MIKPGEIFYAIVRKCCLSTTLGGDEAAGTVHGPFVCTSATNALVQSEYRKFNMIQWTIRRATKKLLQEAI